MKFKYKYLIAYFHATGTGTAIINSNYKLNTAESIVKIAKDIAEKDNLERVAIFNIIRLKKR